MQERRKSNSERIIIPGSFPKGNRTECGAIHERWGAFQPHQDFPSAVPSVEGLEFYADQKRLKLRKQFDILNVAKSLPR